MGSLYWRGNVLWAKYYLNGRPIRESTGKSKQKEAETWLKEREGAVASGQPVLPRADKIRYDEVREDLERHYETTGSRGLNEAGWRFDHLDKFFRGCKLVGITGDVIVRYISLGARARGPRTGRSTANWACS